MHPGELISERFDVTGLARSGGMGDVYRAQDRLTGEQVAVKVLQGNRAIDGARLTREAEALADLRHPGIVRYVAHGATPSGERYLVMEWLEGEDLADRLDRGPLSIEETVELARGVAESLAVAHMRGVIHRDIKPSNLYLPGGAIERCKILDFGIARFGRDAHTATASGMMMGTPGYMAPEQARGDPDLDARTDVFALGCVLFECLTGKPAFMGEHVMALLAKILLEETPRARTFASGVPRQLDDLVSRMMAKEPNARPRDGAAMMAEVAALGAMEVAVQTMSIAPPEAITRREQRLLSVVMIGGEDLFASSSATAPTITSADAAGALTPFRVAVESYGGRLEVLPGGAIVATLSGTGIATDQATRERDLQEIRLGALTRRSSERLVRQILGDDADDATVARLLERAEGNAFYLEELVRAAAAGKGAELPETVLAMVQARLEGLETEARRLLRAGSVFGQTLCKRDAFSRNKTSPRVSLRF